MSGKIVILALVAISGVIGAFMYYVELYAYYSQVKLSPKLEMTLVPKAGGAPVILPVKDFQGIDADSSPIRFRACFTTEVPLKDLEATYTPYAKPVPLSAPGWFGCYDVKTITKALQSGTAKAFLAERHVAPDADRVIAIFPDGRGFAWQQVAPDAPVTHSPSF